MKLIPLYKSLLATASMEASKDGHVSYCMNDSTKPAMIKGKRIVLPTPEHLSNSDWSDRVVFHPLSENILRGESTILEEFRSALNITLNHKIGLLAYQLLIIATSVADHAKLSPDQLDFLSKLKNADEKTLEVFQKLLKAMPITQRVNTFVSIFLKRGGSIAGKRHARVGVVSFPFYTELTKAGAEVYGVKLRVKDRETLINLMEYMFPTIGEAESHCRSSDSDVAPYLDALMKAVIAVAGPINDQISLFSNVIDGADEMMVEDKWVDTFDNLAVMIPEIRKVPMQAGNEGTTPASEVAAKKVRDADFQQVFTATAPPAIVTKSPLPAALMTTCAKPAPWNASTPAGGYPAGNVSAFAAATGNNNAVKTSRGLDFDAICRNNPALGPVGYPNAGSHQMNYNGGGAPRYNPGNNMGGGGGGWNAGNAWRGNSGI